MVDTSVTVFKCARCAHMPLSSQAPLLPHPEPSRLPGHSSEAALHKTHGGKRQSQWNQGCGSSDLLPYKRPPYQCRITLPLELKLAPSLILFHCMTKTFLFKQVLASWVACNACIYFIWLYFISLLGCFFVQNIEEFISGLQLLGFFSYHKLW